MRTVAALLVALSLLLPAAPARADSLGPALHLTRAEALVKADEWLASLLPDGDRSMFRLVESPTTAGDWSLNTGAHSFHWERLAGGYRIQGAGVHIEIDADTGALRAFSRDPEPAGSFVAPEQAPDRTVAEAAYRTLPVEARWVQEGAPDGGLQWRLVYQPLPGYFPYVALDGTLLQRDGTPWLPPSHTAVPVPAADTPYMKPALPLTGEQAAALAGALTGRSAPPVVTEVRYPPSDTLLWELTYETGARVVVDAAAGLILLYERPTSGGAPAADGAVARESAIAFLRTHRPDLAGHLLLRSETATELLFDQVHDGAILSNRTVRIHIGSDGQVVAFDVMPYEPAGERFAFVQPASRIDPSVAMDQWLARPGLELTWVAFGGAEPRLVWAPARDWGDTLDAATGHPLAPGGFDMAVAAMRPTDTAGHPAERAVDMLWSRGILALEQGRFRPDDPAEQADLLRWLEAAARPGFAGKEELAPLANAPVRRDRFALWVVRAMGYGPVAAMPVAIPMSFSDQEAVDPVAANAVAILAGLGLVEGARFEPARPVTRGQAAALILAVYNANRERQ